MKRNFPERLLLVASEGEYVRRAREAIQEVLDKEHAVTAMELQARISERYFERSPGNIDPHHVSRALSDLVTEHRLIRDTAPARGGHDVETIQPADQARRATKISRAASRKRLLVARYSGWAQGTQRHPNGLIGPAGEAAVRSALTASELFLPEAKAAGEVGEILGIRLPGAADSGGYFLPFTNKIPGRPIACLVEVKNVRSWIYPTSAELYQLLHKATVLQTARPEHPVLPILVCRRAHFTTFKMARQLGFFVIPMSRQYVGEVDEDEVAEIRAELHFRDLVRGSEASQRVIDRIGGALAKSASQFATSWHSTALAPDYGLLFDALRKTNVKPWDRTKLINQIRGLAERDGLDGGW